MYIVKLLTCTRLSYVYVGVRVNGRAHVNLSDPCVDRRYLKRFCSPTAMTGPIVPLELQYRTIELVWDRQYTVLQATLRSCALTCRAWLVPSRRRLFRSLVLGPLNRQAQVDVLASLISASRDVSGAVEQLIITTDDGHFSTSTPPGYVRPQVIPIILAAKFPHLRSLVIHSENKVSSFPNHIRTFAAVSSITSLRLQSIRVDVRALRKLLAMFPSLQELSIINLRRTSSRDAPTLMSLPVRLPHLTHIEAMQCVRRLADNRFGLRYIAEV